MVRGEVFVEKAETFIGYVCLDVLAIWGVEPDELLFPFLSASARVALLFGIYSRCQPEDFFK